MPNKLGDLFASFMMPPEAAKQEEHTLQLATAVLLIEVMQADAEIAPEEQAAILAILKAQFALPDGAVEQLVEQGRRTARDANDFYQFTALLNRELDLPGKVRVIENMWRVAYADSVISAHENHLMRKIADLLYIPHGDYVTAKARARGDSPAP